jgi:hypothetical protein
MEGETDANLGRTAPRGRTCFRDSLNVIASAAKQSIFLCCCGNGFASSQVLLAMTTECDDAARPQRSQLSSPSEEDRATTVLDHERTAQSLRNTIDAIQPVISAIMAVARP